MFTVIDAGARYGLHPTWQDLRDLAQFHLFDIDGAECRRLQHKYSSCSNIKVHHKGLYSSHGEFHYQESTHKALNSFYEACEKNLKEINHMVEEFKPGIKKKVFVDTVDNLFKDESIHFLKLDIEGSELELLKGSVRQLENSVLGVRCEVSFRSIYKDAPLFSDINNYLDSFGFELLNLDYDGRGVVASPFTENQQYGYLVSTDGVWILSQSKLFSEKDSEILKRNILYLAIFLFQNGATDVAIHLLLKGIEKGLCYKDFTELPLFKFLEKKILLLFKKISYYPQVDKSALSEVCIKLFGYNFPDMHRFFEKMDIL